MNLHPLKTVWFNPRSAVREQFSPSSSALPIVLIVLAGALPFLDLKLDSATYPPNILAFLESYPWILWVMPLIGIISYLWIWPYMIAQSGKKIGGVGSQKKIRDAIGLAFAPQIASVLAQMALSQTSAPRGVSALIASVAGVWGFVIVCKTVAEAQGFPSALTSIHNFIRAGVRVLVLGLMVLVGVFVVGAAAGFWVAMKEGVERGEGGFDRPDLVTNH